MTEKPLISIITPSLNRAGMIETAIESVLAQNYPHFEHIIVDGGSTDGTLEILSKYTHLRAFSAQDAGMYDALNRGLALAQGEIIGFLNTDDIYPDGTLESVSHLYNTHQFVHVILGNVSLYDKNGLQKTISIGSKPDDLIYNITLGTPIFNAWFFSKAIFERTGLFDPSLKIAGDRDLLLRVWLSRPKVVKNERVVYFYQIHDDSLTFSNLTQKNIPIWKEYLLIIERYLSQSPPEIAQRLLRKWAYSVTLELATQAIHAKDIRLFLKYFARGMKYDGRWVLSFLSRLIFYLFKKIWIINGQN